MILILLLALCQDSSREIESLVRDLGDDLIEVRERAQGALTRIGAPAIPALKKAVISEDPERAARARAVWLRVDRVERERVHDASELADLLERNRPSDTEQSTGRRWDAVTEGGRFALGAIRHDEGLVIYTEFDPLLYRYDRLCQRKGEVRFDLVKVSDLNGRELDLRRCNRCSPKMVLAKGHDGPMRIRVRGVHIWFSRYEVEFPDPEMGQTQQVGDMTIEVAWPRIKVTSLGGLPDDSYRPHRHRFEFEMRPGAQARKPMQVICGVGGGCGARAAKPKPGWCGCESGPGDPEDGRRPSRVFEYQAEAQTGDVTLKDVARITCTIWKPIEIPIDFTVEVTPVKRD